VLAADALPAMEAVDDEAAAKKNVVRGLRRRAERAIARELGRHSPEEAAVLALLQRRLADRETAGATR
jgi:cob(I)alamin adenosyltransferase